MTNRPRPRGPPSDPCVQFAYGTRVRKIRVHREVGPLLVPVRGSVRLGRQAPAAVETLAEEGDPRDQGAQGARGLIRHRLSDGQVRGRVRYLRNRL